MPLTEVRARPHPLAATCLAVAVLAAMAAAHADAQQRPASPPLDPSHWTYAVLDRASAAGLLDGEGILLGDRPISQGAAARALAVAARNATARGSPLAEFVNGALARYGEEFTAAAAAYEERDGALLYQAMAGVGARDDAGVPGAGGGAMGRFGVAVFPHPRIAAAFEGEAVGDGGLDVRNARLAVGGTLGRWWGFVGRERYGYGPGAGGGVVISPAVSFDGVAFGLEEPAVLPGFLRHLGPFRYTAQVSRIPNDSLMRESGGVFTTMRASFSPHPRLTLGANRSTMVVREFRDRRLSTWKFVYMFFGGHTGLEDQKASVDARLRSAPWGVPLETYVEIGAEDTGGAAYTDPGLVAGLHLPVLPGWPAASLRYEYAAFGEDAQYCFFCEFKPRRWYHHRIRTGYMTEEGVPFGHPLAGYGYEHRLQAGVWLADARLYLATTGLLRTRRDGPPRETNLLHDLRPGSSRGAGVEARYRATRSLELHAAGWLERGRSGWQERVARVGARGFLSGR